MVLPLKFFSFTSKIVILASRTRSRWISKRNWIAGFYVRTKFTSPLFHTHNLCIYTLCPLECITLASGHQRKAISKFWVWSQFLLHSTYQLCFVMSISIHDMVDEPGSSWAFAPSISLGKVRTPSLCWIYYIQRVLCQISIECIHLGGKRKRRRTVTSCGKRWG